LVNASRYITLELKQFEEKFFEAESQEVTREYELFLEIREEILKNFNGIKKASEISANVDFITSLSQTAYENGYVKPKITTNYDLKILS
jgi:DNA mismatch repair protein MutS